MPLRIATFNLKDFFAPRNAAEGPIVERKLANLAASLRRANADVVALQEVGAPELVERVRTKDAPDLAYGEPVFGTPDRRGIRNAILSRLPIVWSQNHEAKSLSFPRFYEGDPEPFPNRIPLRRSIVHVRVEREGIGEVDVLTAHFKSGLPAHLKTAAGVEIPSTTSLALAESSLRSLVQRAAEALFLRAIVDDVIRRGPDHAVCVLGDLNDVAESVPVRLLAGAPGAPGSLRSCAELRPVPRGHSTLHGSKPSLIDHLLVSARLAHLLTTYEVHNESLRDHGPHVEDGPLTEDSDHALVLAEFG